MQKLGDWDLIALLDSLYRGGFQVNVSDPDHKLEGLFGKKKKTCPWS